jgi:hypothetical protein
VAETQRKTHAWALDGKPGARQNAARGARLHKRTFEQLVGNTLPNAEHQAVDRVASCASKSAA